MVITERKRVALAVAVALHQWRGPENRLMRVRVLFPDLGAVPVLDGCGLLRYAGEKSIVKPDATNEELALPEGLTINL